MNADISKQLNKQINYELYSAYFYLDISNYYLETDLDGFAGWFRVQTQEERDHAMLIMDYLQDNDEPVRLESVQAPERKYQNAGHPLDLAYAHEQKVTSAIHTLYESAMDKKDYRSMQFLNWFIREQQEEERSVRDLINRYRLFGSDQKSLYLLNSELKSRSYTPVVVTAPAAPNA